ncbi:unnamed protein product [Lupinus luteus]|uniref:Glycosyltransferase n=1 Tax=Lupinus luteus TaxID=3873 RepID=A0AAV1XC02_LUPLU
MGSLERMEKLHAVCIPYPAQGHISPMLKLAKLLHFRGFHITFVNTEYNHKRFLKARGSDFLNALPSFHFETIHDGLPQSDNLDATQDIPSLSDSTRKNCLPHFRNLLSKLNNDSNIPPVSCVFSDGAMSFTADAAQELGIPIVMFWTMSACGFMGYLQYSKLVQKGILPLKDSSYITNGYLETTIDWVPGMEKIRLKDLPSFIRITDLNDIMFDFMIVEIERTRQRASAIILNTFDALEPNVLHALSSTISSPIYTIGPLNFLLNDVTHKDLETLGSNLWNEDLECLKWLDTKDPNSVVFVNFGSITTMTREQMIEFAWGLANSNKTFLWVIRTDLVAGENTALPLEFVTVTKNRSLLSSWVPQEKVLAHPAIGVFLTHNGWNSTLESICGGVPMICWPFFAEQQTNCLFCCEEWGIGLEIEDVKRDKIEGLVRELMDGEKGKEMKERALELKKLGQDSASAFVGSSFLNFDKMVHQVLLGKFD